jgi:hypothetical protein
MTVLNIMKIDEIKNSFVQLLESNFDIEKKEELFISERLLKESDLNNTTFWNIVCPLLKKEGVLTYFNNPHNLGSDFSNQLMNNEEVREVYKKMSFSDFPQIMKRFEKRHKEIEAGLRENFSHKFVVNKEKLLSWKSENQNDEGLFVFQLTKSGILSRKNPIGKDKPYKIGVRQLPHRVIQELMNAQKKSDNFYDTKDLAEVLNVNAGQIRKAVEGMKKRAVNNFNGIHKDDFIESSKNSGYRLNKKIRIIKV